MIKPVPIAVIGSILNEVMDIATSNGADSRSMPDEYVEVAHFVCYPEEYVMPDRITDKIISNEKLEQILGALEIGYSNIRTDFDSTYLTQCADRERSQIQASITIIEDMLYEHN